MGRGKREAQPGLCLDRPKVMRWIMSSAWLLSFARTRKGFYRTFDQRLSQARILSEKSPLVTVAAGHLSGQQMVEQLEGLMGRSLMTTQVINNLAEVALHCEHLAEAADTPIMPYDLINSVKAGRTLLQTFGLIGNLTPEMRLPFRTAELYLRLTRMLLAGYKEVFLRDVMNAEITSGVRRISLDEIGLFFYNRINSAAAGAGRRKVRESCLELIGVYQEITQKLQVAAKTSPA